MVKPKTNNTKKATQIRKLNSLRGLAALIVVLSHYSNVTNLLDGKLGHGAGQLGVMLFFLLSGFLMSHLYMDRDFSSFEVNNFIMARIARVIPLFIIVVLISYALQMLELRGYFFNIPSIPILFSHVVFLSGTSILWTIPAEIQFYILFVFLWWLQKTKEIGLYIFMMISFLIIALSDFPRPAGSFMDIPYDFVLLRSLPYFFSGVLFGKLYTKRQLFFRYSNSAFILSLSFILLLYPGIFSMLFGYNHGKWQDIGVLVSLSLVFFVVVFLVPDSNRLLANRVGDFLGNISYSLYLLHMPILVIVRELAIDQPGIFLVIYLMISFIVSYLSYLLIERPSRKAIRKIGFVAI